VNGITTITQSFIPYNTSLSVTPRATNDGSVFMKLNLQRDTVQTDASGANSTAPRNINTEVVVDSGNTLVLGGVQSTSESSGSRGFPFLRKIPLIGWLFGTESENNDKTELMFFVTPKILNVKKTALGDGGEPGQKPANL
jgi:type IV pilus assembly protein PilQ